MNYITLWIDDHRVGGSGVRGFFVVTIGPKWVTLFYPPKNRTIKVLREVFDKHAHPAEYQPGKMKARMRDNARNEDGKIAMPKIGREVLQSLTTKKARHLSVAG